MGTIWELDFYSRPLLDEKQKKIWELLICESPLQAHPPSEGFRYTQFCSSAQVNSGWLREALLEAMAQAQQTPQKIRFFRRQMNNMIVKACEDAGVPAQASRRTFTLHQWLQERMETVYPTYPNYQAGTLPSVQYEQTAPAPLPDALRAEKWAFANLEAIAFKEMGEWEIGFGEAFPLAELAPETQIPGVVMFSSRGLPLAGWMSGLEPACIQLDKGDRPRLLLETGASDRWFLSQPLDAATQKEAEAFEQAKEKAQGVHFLAIQSDPRSPVFAGFWLLRAVQL